MSIETNPPDRQLETDCLGYFTTGSPTSSGFILSDGDVLDLGTDHDEIARCLPGGDEDPRIRANAVDFFMRNTGAIRTSWGFADLDPDDLYVESLCRYPITDAQKRTLLKAVKHSAGGGRWEVKDRPRGRMRYWGDLTSADSLKQFYADHERCRVG